MSQASFFKGYIETLFLTETDESDDRGGYPLDRNYSTSDFASGTRAKLEKDAARFYARYEEMWTAYIDDEEAGHNFALSRNGHGAGFFDEDDLPAGLRKTLQAAAKSFGTVHLYVGDDGEIHAM